MSLWNKLFGKIPASGRGFPGDTVATESYKGFEIEAQPYKEGGQYQLAGRVSRIVDGVEKSHSFIRADKFASLDDASRIAIVKGKQIVDQIGERVFENPQHQNKNST